MNVLVIGSGGREHAMIQKLAESPKVDRLFAYPGNGGMAGQASCIPGNVKDIPALVQAAKNCQADFVVVAPDDPLVLGAVDALHAAGIPCFGPDAKAAAIEGSKVFSKDLMRKYNIPTAEYQVFDDAAKALDYLADAPIPIVVKADGLALGKGALVCMTRQEALDAVHSMMEDKVFGESGSRVVIEEFMEGPEVSVLAFSDGVHVRPMVSAQDHKRIFDGDKGPNTGGMGAYSPAPVYTEELSKVVNETIIEPTIKAMAAEGKTFVGILYTGIMLTENGPRVLEYNVRFGDPETQPIMMRLKSDLVDIFEAAIDGNVDQANIEWYDEAAVCVVMASGGYPASSEKGVPIYGLDDVAPEEAVVFHSGTTTRDDQVVTNGGRVLGVTAKDATIKGAIDKAYAAVEKITFDNMQFRRDIGARALK